MLYTKLLINNLSCFLCFAVPSVIKAIIDLVFNNRFIVMLDFCLLL